MDKLKVKELKAIVKWANPILGFRIREANGTAGESSGLCTVFIICIILYSYIFMLHWHSVMSFVFSIRWTYM